MKKSSVEKKELFKKLAIPAIIFIALIGVWALKNLQLPKSDKDSSDFALHVTEKIDLDKLKSYGLPIIIDFGSDSCIPCIEMAPVLRELNEELRGKAIVLFVDVWKYQSLATGYPISVIPTQVFIDSNGKPFNPKNANSMKLNLYSDKNTKEHIFTTHEGGISKIELISILEEMGMK